CQTLQRLALQDTNTHIPYFTRYPLRSLAPLRLCGENSEHTRSIYTSPTSTPQHINTSLGRRSLSKLNSDICNVNYTASVGGNTTYKTFPIPHNSPHPASRVSTKVSTCADSRGRNR